MRCYLPRYLNFSKVPWSQTLGRKLSCERNKSQTFLNIKSQTTSKVLYTDIHTCMCTKWLKNLAYNFENSIQFGSTCIKCDNYFSHMCRTNCLNGSAKWFCHLQRVLVVLWVLSNYTCFEVILSLIKRYKNKMRCILGGLDTTCV